MIDSSLCWKSFEEHKRKKLSLGFLFLSFLRGFLFSSNFINDFLGIIWLFPTFTENLLWSVLVLPNLFWPVLYEFIKKQLFLDFGIKNFFSLLVFAKKPSSFFVLCLFMKKSLFSILLNLRLLILLLNFLSMYLSSFWLVLAFLSLAESSSSSQFPDEEKSKIIICGPRPSSLSLCLSLCFSIFSSISYFFCNNFFFISLTLFNFWDFFFLAFFINSLLISSETLIGSYILLLSSIWHFLVLFFFPFEYFFFKYLVNSSLLSFVFLIFFLNIDLILFSFWLFVLFWVLSLWYVFVLFSLLLLFCFPFKQVLLLCTPWLTSVKSISFFIISILKVIVLVILQISLP